MSFLPDLVFAFYAGDRGLDFHRNALDYYLEIHEQENPCEVCPQLEQLVSGQRSVMTILLKVGGGFSRIKPAKHTHTHTKKGDRQTHKQTEDTHKHTDTHKQKKDRHTHTETDTHRHTHILRDVSVMVSHPGVVVPLNKYD